ncbi:MAG: hypothetical protein RL095_2399 [Verrucomicrobiota bacterium]
MKKLILSAIACLSFSCLSKHKSQIFNGKDLSGWIGDNRFWRVEGGTITGETGGGNPCRKTTYLILKDRKFYDFDITFKFRFLSKWANSGFQFRSKISNEDEFDVTGYQADMEMGKEFNGILYEQGGRGVFVNRGQNVIASREGVKVVGSFDVSKVATLEQGKWYTYRIYAKGNHIIQEIDGVRTVECIDNNPRYQAFSGFFALQLHGGPAMKAQFKDFKLEEL